MTSAQDFARAWRLPPKEALAYLQGRGVITPTTSWQDLFHDEHAQQFTVSRLTRADILKSLQDGITRSVNGDLSRRDWMRDAKALLQKEGWWGEVQVLDPVTGEMVTTTFDPARLKLIFDTNTRMAYSAGLWERVWRNKSTHPYLLYMTMGDERVRAQHKQWAGRCLPVEHPFWQTHWPPNGWRCRCSVRSLSQQKYEQIIKTGVPFRTAEGQLMHIPVQTEPPPEQMVEWINKRTGEINRVPYGIDPGFAYNPGLARARWNNLQALAAAKVDSLPAPIRAASMTPAVDPGVGGAFSQEVVDAYAALPHQARLAVAAAGYEVRVVDRIVNAAPDLAVTLPPGYPSGIDYRSVDGATRHNTQEILIAEQSWNTKTGRWEIAQTQRGANLIRHETGHVLDTVHDLSNDPAVQAAWQREATALQTIINKVHPDIMDEINYLTDSFPRGLRETVAELFAIRHGGGSAGHLNAATLFPDTMRALIPLLKTKGLSCRLLSVTIPTKS